jgi:hypothetical protein
MQTYNSASKKVSAIFFSTFVKIRKELKELKETKELNEFKKFDERYCYIKILLYQNIAISLLVKYNKNRWIIRKI